MKRSGKDGLYLLETVKTSPQYHIYRRFPNRCRFMFDDRQCPH